MASVVLSIKGLVFTLMSTANICSDYRIVLFHCTACLHSLLRVVDPLLVSLFPPPLNSRTILYYYIVKSRPKIECLNGLHSVFTDDCGARYKWLISLGEFCHSSKHKDRFSCPTMHQVEFELCQLFSLLIVAVWLTIQSLVCLFYLFTQFLIEAPSSMSLAYFVRCLQLSAQFCLLTSSQYSLGSQVLLSCQHAFHVLFLV